MYKTRPTPIKSSIQKQQYSTCVLPKLKTSKASTQKYSLPACLIPVRAIFLKSHLQSSIYKRTQAKMNIIIIALVRKETTQSLGRTLIPTGPTDPPPSCLLA